MRFDLRLGRASDLPFVVDSWVKRDPRLSHMRLSEATAHVRATLADPDTCLRVACLPDDADAILGYAIVFQNLDQHEAHGFQTLRWVYVRKEARRQGIARALTKGTYAPETRQVKANHRVEYRDGDQSR